MALKRYELWFWNYDPDYPNRLRLVKREVLMPRMYIRYDKFSAMAQVSGVCDM